MERPPKKYVCEKCGYLGDTPDHEGCDYLAWITGEQLYIDRLELAALRASPASVPEGFTMSEPAILPDGSGFGTMTEREAALLGKVAQQSAALKLARQVLMSVKETSSSTRLRRIVDEPLAAINEVLGEVK